jgi:hypothetical protein
VLLLFAPAVSHPETLLYPTFSPYSDLTVIHWPKAHLMAQTWQASHTLPGWTPLNLSGMPLAANQLAMEFYPPAWLFLFLPINPVFNLLFVFHLFWAGLGTYWLLRSGFDLDPVPALSGGLTFALGGKLLAHAAGGHASLVGAMAWMPWALLGTHQVLKGGRRANGNLWPWAALAAAALAMQVATHTLITLYTAYLLAAYVAWQQISAGQSPFVNLKSRYLPLLSIPLLAGCLSAAQWLPLVELAGYSNRALSLAQAAEYALTPLTLFVGIMLPGGQGGHETIIYLGLVPLALGFWGMSRADRRSWFFGLVVVLAVLFALGTATPLFELVYGWLPGFGWVRTPARAFLPASLAVAVLAGLGAQRLSQPGARWSTPIAVGAGALTACLGLGLALFAGQANRATLGLAVFPPLALILAGLAARGRLSPRLALPGLSLLLLADLASFDLSLMRFITPSEAFAEGEPVAAYLADQPGLFRTYSPSYSLPAHVAARAGLQTADGVEPVHLSAYDAFMALAGGYGDSSFSVAIPPFPPDRALSEAFRGTQPDLRLLGLLNVEYLAAAFPMDWPGLTLLARLNETYVYRNEHALPRAWMLPQGTSSANVPGDAGAWRGELAELAGLAARAISEDGAGVRVARYEPDRIEIETHSAQPALLVLGELWYPGWRAVVDGREVPVARVAGLLRGVSLAEGGHRVVFNYDPASVRRGRRLSLAGVFALVGVCGASLWRRK